MSSVRVRLLPRPSLEPRSPSLSELERSVVDARSAGTSPNAMPVSSVIDRRREQHARVERDRRGARNARGALPSRARARRSRASAEARRSAEHREQHALREQLRDHPRPARADRDAHGDFALPPRRAREQHVRDVRARDQQHERDGAENHEQRRAHVSDDLRREIGDAHVAVRSRILLLELRR